MASLSALYKAMLTWGKPDPVEQRQAGDKPAVDKAAFVAQLTFGKDDEEKNVIAPPGGLEITRKLPYPGPKIEYQDFNVGDWISFSPVDRSIKSPLAWVLFIVADASFQIRVEPADKLDLKDYLAENRICGEWSEELTLTGENAQRFFKIWKENNEPIPICHIDTIEKAFKKCHKSTANGEA